MWDNATARFRLMKLCGVNERLIWLFYISIRVTERRGERRREIFRRARRFHKQGSPSEPLGIYFRVLAIGFCDSPVIPRLSKRDNRSQAADSSKRRKELQRRRGERQDETPFRITTFAAKYDKLDEILAGMSRAKSD